MTLPEAVVDRRLSSRESDRHQGDDIMPRSSDFHAGEFGDRQGPG